MKFCEECGKKLGFFEGYRHPAMGKEYLLCSSCFDVIDKSVEEWCKFVTANSFDKYGISNKDMLQECKGILSASHFNFLISILN
jgi:hypothetical protein